jgi:hypothetical protein
MNVTVNKINNLDYFKAKYEKELFFSHYHYEKAQTKYDKAINLFKIGLKYCEMNNVE